MSRVSVQMDGLAELQKKLAKFANSEAVTNVALEKAGEHLRQKIQDMTRVRTGALKEAIVKGEVINGKIQIGPSQQGPAFRAHFVEFGTSKMTAQPFMRPAFESSKSTIEKIMAEEIRKGLGL
jgi:HK97 gp10 family phage protein